MKVTFNVECSPEEARAFLGLPDVAPMQERMLSELEKQMHANIQAMNPEAMMKTWMPTGLQNVEQAQKLFWSQIQQTMTGIANVTSGSMQAMNERASKKK